MFDKKAWQKEYNKKWRLEHPTYHKGWNSSNKQEVQNYHKDYNLCHALEHKLYRLKNKDKKKAYDKKYFTSDRIRENNEKCKEIRRIWNKSSNGKLSYKKLNHNRRNVPGCSKLTIEKIQEVYERNIKQHGTLTCNLCNKPIMFGQDALEHFTPLTRHKDFPNKDLNALDNLGVAHNQFSKEKCNNKKLDKTLEEWNQINMDRNPV